HALRGEGDSSMPGSSLARTANFYPRPPWGGRRFPDSRRPAEPNFYPRPPWGGRRAWTISQSVRHKISIHALRGEGDASGLPIFFAAHRFLSTPSVGRATQ